MRRLALLLVALVAAACTGVPVRTPDIEGVVREVDHGAGTLLVVAVPLHRDHVPAARYGDRVLVRITEATRILKDVGGVYEPVTLGEMVPGDRSRVQAWFVGPVTRSIPPQAEAQVVTYWRLAP